MKRGRARFLKWVKRDGQVYYYHRRSGHPPYPVSSGIDIYDQHAVDEDFQRHLKSVTWSPSDSTEVQQVLRKGIMRAKQRAAKTNRPFDLTLKDVLRLYDQQNGRCAISARRFSAENAKHGRSNPFRPSIDRKDNSGGYTLDNIQIVLAGVNTGRSDFSDFEYIQICRAVARNNTRPKVDTSPEPPDKFPHKPLKE